MGTERTASPALDAFIDKSIDLAKERGYNPTIFIGMRRHYGTLDAIERLVQSGDIQSEQPSIETFCTILKGASDEK